MSESFDRYTDLFLDEASEQIEELNQNLLILERDGYDPEIINEIFRTAHTLKSSAAFVGLEHLSDLAHRMEDLLQEVKDEKVTVATDLVNVFFQCLDRIKVAVAQVSEGKIPEDTFEDLIQSLDHYSRTHGGSGKDAGKAKSKGVATPRPQPVTPSDPLTETSSTTPTFPAVVEPSRTSMDVAHIVLNAAEEAQLAKAAAGKTVFDGVVILDSEAPMKNMRLLLLVLNLKKHGNLFRSIPFEGDLESDTVFQTLRFIFIGDKSRDELLNICQVDSVEEVHLVERNGAGHQVTAGSARRSAVKDASAADETHVKTKNIKVSSEKIDYLLNSVGELVITNSGLAKIYDDMHEEFGDNPLLAELKTKIDQAARIARDLQSGIMKTRMIPVELVFQRFTRPVRDLSLELGKEVDLEFQGEDTELDKNIIDALNDPLLHLIRNSLDHGIEPPEERMVKGKDRRARLLLNAYQSGNNIYVEIRDDGRGLNRDRIHDRAVERGIIPEDAQIADEEIFNLIFQPGFSTASTVTDVSGRGVGMNVVKRMVQEFKGNIQIQNDPEVGCSFILSFPLTLAIISAILVRIDREDYAFPLSDVVETIKVNRDDITTLQGKDIINLRGDILPVFHLNQLMGFPVEASPQEEEFPVVVANVGNRKIGFIVDMMVGKQEIVIKSLEQNFRSVKGLIGACLMGDGSIVMVLDVQGLLDLSQGDDNMRRLPGQMLGDILQANRKYNEQVAALSGAGRRQRVQGVSRKKEKEEEKERDVVPAAISGNGKSLLTNRSSTVASRVAASTDTGERTASSFTAVLERPDSDKGAAVTPPPEPPRSENVSVVTIAKEANSLDNGSNDRVKEVMNDFERERLERIARARSILNTQEAESHSSESLQKGEGGDTPEEQITDEEYSRLYSIINTGMINAGFVLSQLLGVSVEVSVPEFKTIPVQSLNEYIPGDNIIAVELNTQGDFHALITLVFDDAGGRKAAADLMGRSLPGAPADKLPDEEIQSVLAELTNIVGSSILNALANKTGLSLHPSVPEYFAGNVDGYIKRLQKKEIASPGMKAIYISADFFREDMELLGRVFLLPSRPTLKQVVQKI